MVGEVTNRIERFLGRAGGDEDAASLQLISAVEEAFHIIHDAAEIAQLAFAAVAAGQMAACRLQDIITVFPAQLQVALGDRVFIHLCVHGRTDDLLPAAGEKGRREHVIRDAVRHLGDHVGTGRNQDEQVCLLGQGDVMDAAVLDLFECIHDHIVADQGLKGQRSHELCGILGHDDLHVIACFDQVAGQLRRLERGDPSADTQNDCLLHLVPFFPDNRYIIAQFQEL